MNCDGRGRNTIAPRPGKTRQLRRKRRIKTEQLEQSRRNKAVAAYIRLSRARSNSRIMRRPSACSTRFWPSIRKTITPLAFGSSSRTRRSFRNSDTIAKNLTTTSARSLNSADEAQVPYSDVFRFPENWPDVSTMRDAEVRNSTLSKEDQAVQALLDHRLPQVELPNIPFSDAIDYLRDVTGANILVNWKALEADSIDKTTTTVTVALHDVKFSKVLDIILQEAGAGKLAYTIDEGVITVSTADELNKAVKTQVYDITDLLINPNFDPTIQSIGGGSAQVTGGGGGSGGGTLQAGTQSNTTDREQQLTDIKKKIENTVEFSSWKDNDPNGYGQIDDFNNQLIITQTSEVHEKIANLLAQLREAQAVQVSIEARFLTVSRHFLESVGVNISMSIEGKNPNNPNNNWSPITITNGTSGFTALPSTGLPGSLGTNPANGLEVEGTYGLLDDFTVGLLVTAVEESTRLSVVHAPRVTLQNGQGATVYQLTYIPYVSSLNVSVATGAAIAAPVISYATDGVRLIIERALVSADHKYVTLDIDPELDSFLGFTTFTFEIAPAATTATAGRPVCRWVSPRPHSAFRKPPSNAPKSEPASQFPTAEPSCWAASPSPAKSILRPAFRAFPRFRSSSD